MNRRFSGLVYEHFSEPRNYGALAEATSIGHAAGGGAGARMAIYLRVDCDVVEQATFTAFGCGVTIACGSMLTELVTGRSIEECARLTVAALSEALDGVPADKAHCPALALTALRDALSGGAQTRDTQTSP